jgi:hypothetical protein
MLTMQDLIFDIEVKLLVQAPDTPRSQDLWAQRLDPVEADVSEPRADRHELEPAIVGVLWPQVARPSGRAQDIFCALMKGRCGAQRGRGILLLNKPRPLSPKIPKIPKLTEHNRRLECGDASKATRSGCSAPPQRRLVVLLDGSAILKLRQAAARSSVDHVSVPHERGAVRWSMRKSSDHGDGI